MIREIFWYVKSGKGKCIGLPPRNLHNQVQNNRQIKEALCQCLELAFKISLWIDGDT